MPSTITNESLLQAVAAFSAARTERQRAKSISTPRGPSVAARCLQWITRNAAINGLYDTELPLNALVAAWADAFYPAEPNRLTPAATIESQIRIAAKANALPSFIEIQSAKERHERGLIGRAAIVIREGAGEDMGRAEGPSDAEAIVFARALLPA